MTMSFEVHLLPSRKFLLFLKPRVWRINVSDLVFATWAFFMLLPYKHLILVIVKKFFPVLQIS